MYSAFSHRSEERGKLLQFFFVSLFICLLGNSFGLLQDCNADYSQIAVHSYPEAATASSIVIPFKSDPSIASPDRLLVNGPLASGENGALSGALYILSSYSGTALKTFTHPIPSAELGQAMVRVPGTNQVLIGAPGVCVEGCSRMGKVYQFDLNEMLNWTDGPIAEIESYLFADAPVADAPAPDIVDFGASIAVVEINANRFVLIGSPEDGSVSSFDYDTKQLVQNEPGTQKFGMIHGSVDFLENYGFAIEAMDDIGGNGTIAIAVSAPGSDTIEILHLDEVGRLERRWEWYYDPHPNDGYYPPTQFGDAMEYIGNGTLLVGAPHKNQSGNDLRTGAFYAIDYVGGDAVFEPNPTYPGVMFVADLVNGSDLITVPPVIDTTQGECGSSIFSTDIRQSGNQMPRGAKAENYNQQLLASSNQKVTENHSPSIPKVDKLVQIGCRGHGFTGNSGSILAMYFNRQQRPGQPKVIAYRRPGDTLFPIPGEPTPDELEDLRYGAGAAILENGRSTRVITSSSQFTQCNESNEDCGDVPFTGIISIDEPNELPFGPRAMGNSARNQEDCAYIASHHPLESGMQPSVLVTEFAGTDWPGDNMPDFSQHFSFSQAPVYNSTFKFRAKSLGAMADGELLLGSMIVTFYSKGTISPRHPFQGSSCELVLDVSGALGTDWKFDASAPPWDLSDKVFRQATSEFFTTFTANGGEPLSTDPQQDPFFAGHAGQSVYVQTFTSYYSRRSTNNNGQIGYCTPSDSPDCWEYLGSTLSNLYDIIPGAQ